MTAANLRVLDAVFVVGDLLTFRHRKRIHELAALQRIPTFVPTPEYVEGQALAAYGPSRRDQARHAAVYVDKILKGAKAAHLPVEQPREYRLTKLADRQSPWPQPTVVARDAGGRGDPIMDRRTFRAPTVLQ